MVNPLAKSSQADLAAPRVKSVYIAGMAQTHLTEQSVAAAVTLADRLKLAMKSRGIVTGAALAKLAIVERQTVYYWLDGTTKNIETITLLRVSRALGVRPEWLLNGELPTYAPPIPTEDETQIIGFYRRMTASDQHVFMKMAKTLAGDSDVPATKDDPFPRARP